MANVSLNPKVKKAVEYFSFHCFGDERPVYKLYKLLIF